MGRSAVRYIIGIDPGKSGGIAMISEDMKDVCCSRTPGEGDPLKMGAFIADLKKHYPEITLAVMEKVGAMPRQGVTSMFTFGEQCGIWLGALAASGIPVIRVQPQRWQAKLLDSRSKENKGRDSKELSLERARILFPKADLRYKADDGKADALHLARWGVLFLRGDVA